MVCNDCTQKVVEEFGLDNLSRAELIDLLIDFYSQWLQAAECNEQLAALIREVERQHGLEGVLIEFEAAPASRYDN